MGFRSTRRKEIVLGHHTITSDVRINITVDSEGGVVVHAQVGTIHSRNRLTKRSNGKMIRLNFTTHEALDMGLINLEVLQPYFRNL